MSGITGAPSGPVTVKDTATATPFSTLAFADTLGSTETITVTLSFLPSYYYGAPLSSLGTLSDPLGSGTFDPKTGTFTATATVVGMPTPASQILDRLVYTPPPVGDGTEPSIIATVGVQSTNPATGQSTTSTTGETLQIVTPPSITGTVANQPVAAGGQLDPFAPARISDGNYGATPTLTETITITDSGVATDADGLLTGNGLSKTGVGTYVLSGYSSYSLSSLVFTAANVTDTHTAKLTLAASDSATGYTTTDTVTSVQIIGSSPAGGGGGGGGGSGQTTVLGGGDVQYAAPAGETVLAGSGHDTVTATTGQVDLISGAGTLAFLGGTGPSTVTGGAGSSTILGGVGGGYFTGGRAGFNVLVSQGASGANTTLTGSGAGDQIFGSAAGNDALIAGSGRDSILGGGGNTTIQGGAAASVIFAGAGATTVFDGTAGGDTVVAGAGSVKVNAQGGDAIFGGSGAMNVSGSKTGADSIVGGAGALNVDGQGENMLVVGGTTTSNIQVGNGASLIFTEAGSTTVTGGLGSLQVVLGSGNSTINEGGGPALFDAVNGSGGGNDVLNGFRPATDKVELFGFLPSQQHVSVVGGSTLISLSDGTRIDLVGVTNAGSSIIG